MFNVLVIVHVKGLMFNGIKHLVNLSTRQLVYSSTCLLVNLLTCQLLCHDALHVYACHLW